MKRLLYIMSLLILSGCGVGANPNLAATSNALYGYSTPYYQPTPLYYQRPPMYVGGYQTVCMPLTTFGGTTWRCRQI